MERAKAEICKLCGSPAVLFLRKADKGRHCDNCGAGWFVIPRQVNLKEMEENRKAIDAKMKKAVEASRVWLKEQQEKLRAENPDRQ